jgi:hypothetical protein
MSQNMALGTEAKPRTCRKFLAELFVMQKCAIYVMLAPLRIAQICCEIDLKMQKQNMKLYA